MSHSDEDPRVPDPDLDPQETPEKIWDGVKLAQEAQADPEDEELSTDHLERDVSFLIFVFLHKNLFKKFIKF